MNFNEFVSEMKKNTVKNIILDTDTYNEIDDQFAVAWAVIENGKRLNLLSINAAPFYNNRSSGPKDGMEKSYEEISRLMGLIEESGFDLKVAPKDIPVYKGSEAYLPSRTEPVISDAAKNIVDTVKASDTPVYVVAIGAITNVASAILMDPSIVNNMAVIWLGGHAWHHSHSMEFNMRQDVPAAQVVLDSKVPFLQVPCVGVCDMLHTTVPELKYYLDGKNKLSTYLCNIVASYNSGNAYCWSKVIWDVSAVAAIITKGFGEPVVLPTPILTGDSLYAFDTARHPMLYVRSLNRDRIFADLFKTITNEK
ncbi:MAG: nucleoside hydrolase [Ruminococcaceae bacterium]|nr:nucleoside hydrolase [Oscillospiraceae bacterium]